MALGSAGTFDRLQFDNALLADSTALLRRNLRCAARRNLNLLMVQEEDAQWNLTSDLLNPVVSDDLAVLQEGLSPPTVGYKMRCLPNSWPKQACAKRRLSCIPWSG